MKSQQKPKPEIYDVYDDEIDLFELFRKIWKWKWLIVSIILIICGATFSYLKYSPYTFTSISVIQIGQIAGKPIEQRSNIDNYLRLNESQTDNSCKIMKTVTVSKEDAETAILIEIKSVSNSPESSLQCIKKINEYFISRHKMIYENALKKIKAYNASPKTIISLLPEFFLETYTFPSSVTLNPEKPSTPDSKKLPVKMAVAFFASLFFGIFLSFFIDYILTHIKGKK